MKEASKSACKSSALRAGLILEDMRTVLVAPMPYCKRGTWDLERRRQCGSGQHQLEQVAGWTGLRVSGSAPSHASLISLCYSVFTKGLVRSWNANWQVLTNFVNRSIVLLQL